MAVHIKLIRNNIKRSSGYGKYYAKAVSQGEITLNAGRRIAGGHILYDFCQGVKAVWQKGFKP